MTLPASLRINAQFPFPSLVVAAGPVTVSKSSGIWTVGFNIANLSAAVGSTPGANQLLVVYDQVTGGFHQLPLSSLAGFIRSTRTVLSTGNIAVLASDLVLLLAPTVPAPCNVQLPSAQSRFGLGPITVKDIQGFAAANNISITPNGTDTIDGVNAAVVLNDNFEAMTLNPLAAGGWWIG